ncbi:hypothetical protein ABFA07_023462 [Porites harrisoni]
MSTEHDEAEPENDQSSEPKSKLFKCNFQQSWLEKYKQLKFNPPKGRIQSGLNIPISCHIGKRENPGYELESS